METLSGVFDAVPFDTPLPYAVLDTAAANAWSTKSFTGQRHRLIVSIFSQAPGDTEIKTLADRVHGLLDRPALTLKGHNLVELSFDSLQTLREPGSVRQAQLRFVALTHPE